MSILSQVYLGNTILQYLIAFAILAGGIIIGRIFYWLFRNVFKAFTVKTKSHIDDLLVEALKGPVVFFIFYLGYNYAYRTLTFSEGTMVFFGKVAFILVIINITWLVRNIINMFILNYFEKIASKTESVLDDQLMPVIKVLVNFVVFAIAIIYIIDNLGYDIGSLIAGLGIGGLAFALAAQDTLKNLFGGFTVFADKPFKVGDRVRIDELRDGFIREIGVRSTKMETFDGTKIIVPNSVIVNSILENVSAERARRIKVILGIDYNTSADKLQKACNILEEIIKKNKKTDDKSLVSFKEFGASSLNIQLIYWIKDLDKILETQHEINMEIKKRFDKEKLSFAFPTQTVYLKK